MKFLLTLILGGALYVTNPTLEEFNFFLKQQIDSRVTEENPLAKLFIGSVVTEMVKQGVYRKDYILFSKYTIDTSLIAAFKEGMPPQVEFIGVFGNFYPTTDVSRLK